MIRFSFTPSMAPIRLPNTELQPEFYIKVSCLFIIPGVQCAGYNKSCKAQRQPLCNAHSQTCSIKHGKQKAGHTAETYQTRPPQDWQPLSSARYPLQHTCLFHILICLKQDFFLIQSFYLSVFHKNFSSYDHLTDIPCLSALKHGVKEISTGDQTSLSPDRCRSCRPYSLPRSFRTVPSHLQRLRPPSNIMRKSSSAGITLGIAVWEHRDKYS